MNQHTPGPWGRNIKPASRYPVIYAGRSTHVAVVTTQGLTDQELEANCDLIAAAPELLAALQDLVHAATHHLADGRAAVDQARAAIARATGGVA